MRDAGAGVRRRVEARARVARVEAGSVAGQQRTLVRRREDLQCRRGVQTNTAVSNAFLLGNESNS